MAAMQGAPGHHGGRWLPPPRREELLGFIGEPVEIEASPRQSQGIPPLTAVDEVTDECSR
jgi:hypothetical protein